MAKDVIVVVQRDALPTEKGSLDICSCLPPASTRLIRTAT